MATYSATDLTSKPKHLGQYGEVNMPEGKVTPSANVVTGDVLRICIIPAGTEVGAVIISNGSMGGPAPADIGYAPVSSGDGSLAANATYFKAALALGTAADGTVLGNFDQVKFEQDVYLTATFGTVVSGTANTVRGRVLGKNVGIK
jgi:hypothetical protein